ncbi:hypothetical protein H0274_12240 [Altererythrobacter sp. CC-YST694]|uniref:hypothetical protein n=1 Tax=Altererythrobacter sp. CC-YST694 TaxID=2755038 RepID=UPI001D03463F|nr:hypothetical protein [Altererythrobacter sp. CC-YST694]MCB5426030.1 hypothetical protein [Altererythrobacter sp. CC-YST694]
MRKTLVLAVLAAATSPVAAIAVDTDADRVDVAYEALSEGRTAEAIAKLDRSEGVQTSDPATLINLGTAYAREGRFTEARDMFNAAMNSQDHYYLELADGSWVDSRKAAKAALKNLEKNASIALR